MTGIDPERMERRLRWAAEQLGLSPHASPEEVRAAWLRRLSAEDFVPSSELCWALAALLHRPSEGGWEARADEAASVAEEEKLRGEIEAFAGRFWDLPTGERRRCWQELMSRCALAPALRARLRLLEAGLDCVADVSEAKEDARVVEVANHIRTLFVLRPGPRVQARQDILNRINDHRKAWKAAAWRLRRVCPKLASLEKDFLDKIGNSPPKVKPLRKLPTSQPIAQTSRERKFPLWLFYFIAIALSQFVRLACNDSPSSHKEGNILKLEKEIQKQDEERRYRKKQIQPGAIQDKEDREIP